MKKFISLVLVLLMGLSTVSCKIPEGRKKNYGVEEKPFQFAFDAFDTQCSISFYGVQDETTASQYFYAMKNLVERYEEVFSKTNEVASIFEIASSLYEWSGKKFDISLGTLIDLWDVKNRKTVPTLAEINEARKHTGNFNYTIERNVNEDEFTRHRITFTGDKLTQYDFGALVKGYCCDALKEMLAENENIKACIVNLGGNVLCTGEVDGRADSAFRVGVFKPFSGNDIIDTIEVKNRNVITSGNYQRYFKVEGDDRVYHHIIDPTTGYPTNNVTIVSEYVLLGDYLSTACMLLGEEKSKDLIDFASKSFNDKNIQATFVYSDGRVTKYPLKVNLKK